MNDRTLLIILLVPMVVAFAFGIWAGLGYPGRYDKYEPTGKVPRTTPFERWMEWLVRRLDRK